MSKEIEGLKSAWVIGIAFVVIASLSVALLHHSNAVNDTKTHIKDLKDKEAVLTSAVDRLAGKRDALREENRKLFELKKTLEANGPTITNYVNITNHVYKVKDIVISSGTNPISVFVVKQ